MRSSRAGWHPARWLLTGARAECRSARRLPAGPMLLLLFALSAAAQPHAHWQAAADPASAAPGGSALLRLTATVDPGWHLYSASSPAGLPTSFQFAAGAPVESARVFQIPPKRAFDPNFNADTETYEGEAQFALQIALNKDAAPGAAQLPLAVRFQTCNDKQCVPGHWSGTVALTIDANAPAAAPIPSGFVEAKPPAPAAAGTTPASADQGLGVFLLAAFGFGLATIFTPCVFPMIPITMSYFLNRQSSRRDSVVQAVVFCLGIIVLFSGLGLATTAILGPIGVVQLGANKWVNGFIAALFVAFGLSLLGAFEITIPSSVLTRLNQSADRGGFIGTLLMGLAFSLSSFACVGPFVGTLLAASVAGGSARPLIGMVVFATGLALPFFLLALFPSYLKRLPRSGGWMARVKVVMGFVILAASLKYAEAVDQTVGWDFLTRPRFLAAWIVLFAMAGLYLLGFVRLEGIKPDEPMGIGRLLIGMAFLVFALSLFPGMSGGRLGSLDAFVPAGEGGDGGGTAAASGLRWIKDDYRAALDEGRREGKLIFVNFTGVTCANCKWMEANVFPRPEITAALQKFVLVELYTDRTDTVSAANEQLEEQKFQTVAEPFYAIVDADEKVVATFAGRTGDTEEFLAFLNKGASASPSASSSSAPTAALPAQSLALSDLDGKPIDTAGKVTVLNFWATWCAPCLREIPSFGKMQKDFGAKGLVVVGLNTDRESGGDLKPFLAKHPMDYSVAIAPDALKKQFNVGDEGLPVTVILDRSGRLLERLEGFQEEDKLKALIQKAL
ncbi:MAG TPA: cytochrome c biogenesis protein CcdA [Bryobacteraceae bacterium]|nr:cytochrome c biogenesis protein CcdA [Bryobacteraceae bacterium]